MAPRGTKPAKTAEKKTSDKKEKKDEKNRNAWLKYGAKELKDVEILADEYKKFISDCKTERECAEEIVRQAEAAGYRDLAKLKKVKAGDKVYSVNKGKAVALFVVGKEPLEKGMKILGAHIDSPRLDIKQNPLYEDTEFAMLETHYYGGIKKYQWVTLPMAIHGVVCRKDGTNIKVVIGEDPSDPVVGISDLLIHLAQDQLKKDASKVVEGEDLNITVGSRPVKGEEKEAVKANILKLLKDKYGFEEDDFLSAELEIVPAGPARDYGLDRSMVMGYGQDDRICAFTSAKALFNTSSIDRTGVCILVDKEEIGSVGATGMHSVFFENMVAELMEKMGDYSELKVRRALANSHMLSSDVSAAYDPNYPSVMEKKNCAYMGKGMGFNKFTGSRGKSGSNDANPEFIAKLRAALDKHKVSYQFSELGKVDQGGGGTIAYIMAKYNMEVIDSGVALHNMHAPWEISSKIDIYETEKGYEAFLKEL
ncbi:MAG: aminopeptidase [Lachnospiraceae bacterium]|nr:aminopeptidase [Lachnospiraceae bacterium]